MNMKSVLLVTFATLAIAGAAQAADDIDVNLGVVDSDQWNVHLGFANDKVVIDQDNVVALADLAGGIDTAAVRIDVENALQVNAALAYADGKNGIAKIEQSNLVAGILVSSTAKNLLLSARITTEAVTQVNGAIGIGDTVRMTAANMNGIVAIDN